MSSSGAVLVGSYDYLLVALSIVIAVLAAYAALDFARRVTAARGSARALLLSGGAVAMGIGIWSMHYIGMLAFRLPVPVDYDWPTVLLSLLAAILASAVALFVVSRDHMGLLRALLGSVVMGGGIASMHYIGMEAMRLPAMCTYSPGLVALSVVLAIVISLVALWITFHMRADTSAWGKKKVLSALVMGAAIPVMHYTGMAAVTFTAGPAHHQDLSHSVNVSAFSMVGIIVVTVLVLGLVPLMNLKLGTFSHTRQLTIRHFLFLSTVGLLAVLGTILVEYEGRSLHNDDPALNTALGQSQMHEIYERKDRLYLTLMMSLLGVLLLQGVVVLRPALRKIQDGITELELAKQALHRAQQASAHHADELARSNAELEQFAYVASHDLQEPLRMVASYTQLLSRRYKGKLDNDADEFIGFAVDGAQRMQTLIRDLLSYARLTTKGQSLQPTDTRAICETALGHLRQSIQDAHAAVSVGTMPTVLGYGSQLTQLFQNLIGNAIKYCNRPHPQIQVSARRESDCWVFSVKDNGIGIEPQYYERIFQMFQRLHTREEYSGTGIGLALCKKIVSRHRGRIWVESQPGEGSDFLFTIPSTEGAGP